VWRRPGLLRQSNPGVPSGVMVSLRGLTRTGRLDCWRPCASFPPSLGYTAMSILFVARWRSARGMIEWLCTHERWNPEVAIIFSAAARYRQATVGSSHDDARPDNSALRTGVGLPPRRLCGESLPHIALYGPWQFASVRNISSFFVHFVGVRFSCGGWCIHVFQWASRGRRRHQCAIPTSWIFWNLIAHPLLGEENSTSSPRWL
jgi:hypothetical protein